MSEPLLRVRDLQVEFRLTRGTLRAVDGASFEVHPGEALGIVGESGSGKTMALRALVGLLPRAARITGGTVEIAGVDVTAASEEQRRELRGTTVSMIFQEPMTALNPMHTIGRQIAEPLRRHKGFSAAQGRKEAIALLDRVEQLLIVERLGEKLQRASLHRSNRHRNIAASGDEYDWQFEAEFCQLRL